MPKQTGFLFVLILSIQIAYADNQILGDSDIAMTLPPNEGAGEELVAPAKEDDENLGRVHFYAARSSRGTSIEVPVRTVAAYCGDFDGCKIRLGMYNWDNTGRVASRETLMYFNRTNHAWRASVSDPAGTDFDGVTQHVIQSWACYFKDGKYQNFENLGDPDLNFGLLSWSQYNADCRLSIID